MKRVLLATVLLAFVFVFSGQAIADSGKVVFYDQKGQAKTFNSADVQSLGLKVIPAKPLSKYKFDYLRIIVSPSYNTKMEWRGGWNADEIDSSTLSEVVLLPKGKLINGYKNRFMIEDIREYPSAKGYETFTLNAKAMLFKKTGESKETRWDSYKKKFITETIYQWDDGVEIASGSATFNVPKLSTEAKEAIDKDKSEKLKQLNAIRKKMGKPPLDKLP